MSGQKVTRGQRLVGMIAKAAVVGLLALPSAVLADPGNGNSAPLPEPLNVAPNVHWFSDWEVNSNPAPQDFYATPFARSDNVPAVQAELTASGLAGTPLGIKITAPGLTTAAANALYNTRYTPANKVISYIFGDIEGSPTGVVSNVSPITTMVSQVRNSKYTKNAYVGEFELTPLSGVATKDVDHKDPTRRGPLPYTQNDYNATGVSMANTELYPGSPTYRNRSTFDWNNANIRTGLFVAPLGRMTQVQNVLNQSYNGLSRNLGPAYHKQIPWVTRFNNFGNHSLDNGAAADNHAFAPYEFHPGTSLPQAALTATQTQNQMMGRGDFSAQILHYRMRGAYSLALFEPGVVGYTKSQEQQDVRDGWYGASDPHVAHANNIFAASDSKAATMTLNPTIDGTSLPDHGLNSEKTGTIWSGEYSLSQKKLDILASNLDTINHLIKFGQVDAYDVFTKHGTGAHAADTWQDSDLLSPSRNSTIEKGMHRLLQFDLVTTRVYSNSSFSGTPSTRTIWLLNQNYVVFQNNSGRNDTGIPEPTTFGMLAAAGSMAVVCRRQRRKDA